MNNQETKHRRSFRSSLQYEEKSISLYFCGIQKTWTFEIKWFKPIFSPKYTTALVIFWCANCFAGSLVIVSILLSSSSLKTIHVYVRSCFLEKARIHLDILNGLFFEQKWSSMITHKALRGDHQILLPIYPHCFTCYCGWFTGIFHWQTVISLHWTYLSLYGLVSFVKNIVSFLDIKKGGQMTL